MDGHDEWEFVTKESVYNKIMSDYYDSHPVYNGEGADAARDYENKIREVIYGVDEYRFNGGT